MNDYKIGDIFLCKRNYSESEYSSLIAGDYYEINNIFGDCVVIFDGYSKHWFCVDKTSPGTTAFEYFYDYFYGITEMRKLKLKEIESR